MSQTIRNKTKSFGLPVVLRIVVDHPITEYRWLGSGCLLPNACFGPFTRTVQGAVVIGQTSVLLPFA